MSETRAQYIPDVAITEAGAVWSDLRAHTDLPTAITAMGSTRSTILISRSETISGDLEVPVNVELKFVNGAKLTIATGITLTIKGGIDAGNIRIFIQTGTGRANYTKGEINTIWYASDGDGTTTSKWVDAVKNAYQGCARGGTYRMPAGYYSSATTTTVASDGVEISGDGISVTNWTYSATDGSACLKYYTGGANYLLYGKVHDMLIDCGTADAIALELVSVAYFTLEDTQLKGCRNGGFTACALKVEGWTNNVFRNCLITVCDIGIYITENPTALNDMDLFQFEHIVIACGDTTNAKCVKIDVITGSDLIFDGGCEFSDAAYAIYWDSDLAPSQQANFLLQGGRAESINTTVIYADFSGGQEWVNFTVRDFYCAKAGTLFLDGKSIKKVLLDQVYAPSTAAGAVTLDSTCRPVSIRDCNFGSGATLLIDAEQLTGLVNTGLLGGVSGEWGLIGNQPKLYTGLAHEVKALTYGANITTEAPRADIYTITVTDGNAVAIDNPGGSTEGTMITYIVYNGSGGVMGNITLGANFMTAGGTELAKPATTEYASITFVYALTKWIEVCRTEAIA
jgi:hypothetical protein